MIRQGVRQRLPKLSAREEKAAYEAVTKRDYGSCVKCGRAGVVDRDHRQNRDAWNTTVGNLQLLGAVFGCGCHKWKTENPADAVEQGFAVPRWADPLQWPAYRFDAGWVLYFDEADSDGCWWECITAEQAARIRLGYGKERA